uniref:hypothetical protein n=1 Tax=Pedobacter schmidteae TaxID=2201271 RepID=UPI0013CF15B9|nr:hypothetical protein [Pedobacter schmidteae]
MKLGIRINIHPTSNSRIIHPQFEAVPTGLFINFSILFYPRINDIQKMDADTKSTLFNVIDTYIQNFKTKQAFR